jgi:RNA polymerase sigma-70 factor (ECF subfamily)
MPVSEPGPLPRSEAEIARLIACGAAVHPGIGEPPALRELLAALIAQGARDLEARAPDLYLATACVAGDAAAIALLDARLPAIVRPALARLGVAACDDDEILQRVRVELLARGSTGACGLAGYSGLGELRSYLRAVTVRIALKRLQRESAPAAEDQTELLALVPDANDSAELRLLKERCRDDVRAAFATALAGLTARERTLLRQHYVDGLTVDMLAPLHQAHRSTCARWIEAARVKILRGIRSHLRSSPSLDKTDIESAVALVRSQLDLSLSRQLATQG